jgi:ADP-heptose:LPS heptosyltransferase
MPKDRFAEIAYYCPVPLERLFAHSFGPDITLSSNKYVQREPRFTHAVPLLSLPRVFATDLASVPARVPYLAPAPADVAAWRDRLAGLARPRIGIAWVGGAALALRSMTLPALFPLLERRGVSWVNLSKAASPEERAEAARRGAVDPLDACGDFADTAALIAQLDLVISIDTAVAHLAGALARPVWLLNRFESDWRWMRGRADSPWYPTLRIFNQPRSGDWAGAVDAIDRALSAARLGERP